MDVVTVMAGSISCQLGWRQNLGGWIMTWMIKWLGRNVVGGWSVRA